jgi:hypothetical protein
MWLRYCIIDEEVSNLLHCNKYQYYYHDKKLAMLNLNYRNRIFLLRFRNENTYR